MKRIIFLSLASLLLIMPAQSVAASSLSTTVRLTPGIKDSSTDKATARAVSDDGRIMAFSSTSDELIPGHDGGFDIFIYDRQTNQLELVRGYDGQPLSQMSFSATVSGNGRFVTFFSYARNAVPGVPDDSWLNLYVYDRVTKKLTLANLDSDGKYLNVDHNNVVSDQPVLNYDGRYIAFRTETPITPRDTNRQDDIVLRDLKTGQTRPVSLDSFGRAGAGHNDNPTISQDGRFVSFISRSPLVTEDQNRATDVYLRDMQLGKTTLISRGLTGQAADGGSAQAVMSQDGTHIAYMSWAKNLVTGDTNNAVDIFLHKIADATTRRISVNRQGVEANDASHYPDISRDGRYVVYSSWADNLVRADTNDHSDVFLYYRDLNLTRRVNRASHDGAISNKPSYAPSISANGKAVYFQSSASNLTVAPEPVPERQLYLNYNPVVDIPFYDPIDMLDGLW